MTPSDAQPPLRDPKQGEREYYARLGAAGLAHAQGKPFSDERCNEHVANLAAIFQLLPPPPARIVEFGCGVGWLSLLLARRGYHVHGVDISPDAIAAARRAATESGLENLMYSEADYETFHDPLPADAVLFYDSLHHAEDPTLAVNRAAAILRPGGMMIAFEPGDGHHDSELARQIIAEFDVHENDMPARRIIKLGREAGLRRHLVLPFPWNTLRHLYRPGYARARSTGELFRRYCLGMGRLLLHLCGRRKEPGFVVLWK